MMSAHYKTPILLIEFDEKKSFTLEVCGLVFLSMQEKNIKCLMQWGMIT
jgi:hypothetical protein